MDPDEKNQDKKPCGIIAFVNDLRLFYPGAIH